MCGLTASDSQPGVPTNDKLFTRRRTCRRSLVRTFHRVGEYSWETGAGEERDIKTSFPSRLVWIRENGVRGALGLGGE